MNTTINALLSRMNEDLERIALTAEHQLQLAEQCYQVVQLAMQELKEYALTYTFRDKEEEINFFKEVKPLFLKELIYYAELFDIESNKPVASKKILKDYYLSSLNRVSVFFERHQWLYMYHRIGKTNFDDMFYTRDKQPNDIVTYLMPEIDNRFSTLYSFKLSKIQAFETLKDYLQRSMFLLDNPELASMDTSAKKTKSRWTDSKNALIELAYALHARGSVNHGKGTIKQIITDLEILFNVQLGNYYRTFQNMRTRKKTRSPFLDGLQDSLGRFMDDTDLA
jgi:hypothetical protein